MKAKVLAFLRQQRLTAPGDQVICAVSGGRDSMAMLEVLRELSSLLDIAVSAAHFNHHLRAAESDRDEAFVRSFCADHAIPLQCGGGDVAAWASAHRCGVETAARTLRYQFFSSLDQSAKIATAHTADDNLETLLLHLIRGTDLHGLGGIPPARGALIRPLLAVERREIDAYLDARRIPHVEDSSNQAALCGRNRLRQQVIPLLKAENPALAASVSALCLRLRQEDTYLDTAAAVLLDSARLENTCLAVPPLRAAPACLRRRCCRQFLQDVPALGTAHLEAAEQLICGGAPSARLSLSGGFRLRRDYDRLVLDREIAAPLPEPRSIAPGERLRFGPFTVACKTGTAPPPPGVFSLPLRYEKSLTLRLRRPGDRLRLPGGTKKLSRYLIDRKCPAPLRDQLPVVAHGPLVLGMLPDYASADCAVAPGAPCILLTLYKTEDCES